MTTEFQAAEIDTVELSAETVRVLVLHESALQHSCSSETPTCSFDPYNSAITIDPKPRKSLDDMRRLSETIKRARARRTEQDLPKG